MAFTIRRATPADAARLARCRLDLFRELTPGPISDIGSAFEDSCHATLGQYLLAGTCVAWLAETPGTEAPIGSLAMLTFPRLPSPRNFRAIEGYVLNVYVVPAHRHQGIASALTQAAIEHARREKFARLRLHSAALARAVYERAGFYGRDDEMELDLAP